MRLNEVGIRYVYPNKPFDFSRRQCYKRAGSMCRYARRSLGSAALLLALVAPSFAQTLPKEQGTFEFYYGRYDIKDTRFTDVYQKGGSIQGLLLSSALAFGFDFYSEIKAFYKTGTLTFTEEKTTFLLLPLALGVRYILPGNFLRPYAGGGMDFYFYYENNPIATTLNITTGYHLTAGLYLQFGKNSPLRLNGKVAYTRVKTTEDGITIELGGLEYGAGIAIVF